MKFSKGFTLIELLVVIAIIGILSSVVLASLNTARAKGSDAAIKSQLAAIRPQAEIFYDNYLNAYASTTFTAALGCSQASTMFVDPTIKNQIAGVTGNSTSVVCAMGTNGGAWAISALLKGSSSIWCVDSTGASKISASAPTTSAVCP